MKRSVGIYRAIYPEPSQPFITEQMRAMTRYSPYVLARMRASEWEFPGHALCESTSRSLQEHLYMLTAKPIFYGTKSLPRLDLIHAHFGPDGIYAMRLADKLGIPFMVTFHGFDVMSTRHALWTSGKPSVYQFLLREHALKARAGKFVAVSDFIKKNLIQQGYPAERIVRHYIGVDTSRFSPGGQSSDRRYILSVARHSEGKGLDKLIRAFAQIAHKHPDVTLVQIGAGDLTESLKALVSSLEMGKRIEFMGAQPHDVVLKLMREAEVFSQPSVALADGGGIEALGIVFNEASACGVPIVATNVGGIPEAVLDGETGLLVEPCDAVALGGKLDLLLSDRALAKRMGNRGREYVCDVFDIRKQTATLEDNYDSLG